MLELKRRPVAVDAVAEYVSIGVRSFGKGIFHYEPKPGAELSKLRYFEVHPGELVVSNIKAWEGAVAVSGEREQGCIASNRFLTYVARNGDVDLGYLRYFFLSDAGLPLIQRASPGSADRNRTLAIDRFEALEVPLPRLDEQQRLAAQLDRLLERAASLLHATRDSGASKVAGLQPLLVETVIGTHTTAARPLRDLVDFVSDLVRPGDDPAPAKTFVGLQHIESHTGRRMGDLPLGDEKGRKFRFIPGDVLYGYLRPYLNKVWLADLNGLCSVEQYVLRSRGEVPAEYIAHALRSASVLREANRLTHNLQLPRLRSGLLAQIEIPIANGSYESVLGELDSIRDRVVSLAEHARARATRVAALEKSILNHAFAGKL